METFLSGLREEQMVSRWQQPPPRTDPELTNRCTWIGIPEICKHCNHYADHGVSVLLTNIMTDNGRTTCGAHRKRRSLVLSPWTPMQQPRHYVPRHRGPPVFNSSRDDTAAAIDWFTCAVAYAPAFTRYPMLPPLHFYRPALTLPAQPMPAHINQRALFERSLLRRRNSTDVPDTTATNSPDKTATDSPDKTSADASEKARGIIQTTP